MAKAPTTVSGNDMQQEIHDRDTVAAGGCHGAPRRINGAQVEYDAIARPIDVHHDETQQQGRRGNDFEVHQRFDADACELLHVAHFRDAHDHRGEDDRLDHHFDELDEQIAERLQLLGRVGQQISEKCADQDGAEHLNVEAAIEAACATPSEC